MKLFLALGVLAAAYTYLLLYNANIVLTQTRQLNATYQFVANNADRLAGQQMRPSQN